MKTPAASDSPMMIPDVEALRAKLMGASGTLGDYWATFQTLASAHSTSFPLWPNLAFLVTRDRSYVDSIRAIYLDLLEKLSEADFVNDVQNHIWCTAFPFSRFAIGYDWIADADVFSEAERRKLEEAFVRFIYHHPFMRAKGRSRSSNNQIMAMAFSMASVGYLFGRKRGRHPIAESMWAEAMVRWPDFLESMPAGGYSLEGSTYHSLVVGPAYALWSAFLEDELGMDVFDRLYPPGKSTIHDILNFTQNLASPGGLLPGWDNYGFMRSAVACPLVYLARRTRDPRPLQTVVRHNMFHEPDHMAWQNDDRLWSLVWWPEDMEIPDADVSRPWMVPEVGAALEDVSTETRLFQYWDECAGGMHYGRSQVNPSSITLEAFGSPLLVDGVPADHCRPACMVADTPAVVDYLEVVGRRDGKKYGGPEWASEPRSFARFMGDGGICSANSVVVDDEGWYGPIHESRGQGIGFHAAPGLQVAVSESKDYYRPHYDIESIVRTSLLVGGEYTVVADRIAATSAHDFAWQAFTRADAVERGGDVEVRTKEGTFLRLQSLHDGERDLIRVDGFPRYPEPASHRLRLHSRGEKVSFDVLLQPGDLLEPLADVSDGWTVAGRKRGRPAPLARLFAKAVARPADEPRAFERVVELDDSKVYLSVPYGNTKRIRLTVNGLPVEPTLDEGPVETEGGTRLTRTVWDLRGVARAGANVLALEIPFFGGTGFLPPVLLCKAVRPPRRRTVRWLAPEVLQVGTGPTADRLIVANLGGAPVRAPGLVTNAHHGLIRKDRLTLFAVTSVQQTRGLSLDSLRPVDLQCGDGVLSLSGLDGEHSIRVGVGGGSAEIVIRDTVLVRCTGALSLCLKLALPGPRPVFVNDRYLGMFEGEVDIDPTPSPLVKRRSVRGEVGALDEVAELRLQGSPAAARRLVELAETAPWPVRTAAVLALGERRHVPAVPLLLRILLQENREDLYPPVPAWWRWGTMRHEPEAPDAREHMVTTDAAARRYRLVMVVAVALGRIGDQRAVGPLLEQLRVARDFYPATSNVIVALARLGAKQAIPLLAEFEAKGEHNCRVHAGLALRCLRSEISRDEFEAGLSIN